MKMDFLQSDEKVLMSGKANKTTAGGMLGSKGGMLVLTDKRLVFQAGGFNIGTKFFEFPLTQIALSGGTLNLLCPTPNSIRVTMKDGSGSTFIVVGKDKEQWKQIIGQVASAAQGEP
jgi:hypothetical protein